MDVDGPVLFTDIGFFQSLEEHIIEAAVRIRFLLQNLVLNGDLIPVDRLCLAPSKGRLQRMLLGQGCFVFRFHGINQVFNFLKLLFP